MTIATHQGSAGPLTFFKRLFAQVSKQQLSGYAQMVAYNVLFATAPLLMVLTAGAAAITRAVNSDMENPAVPVLNWMQENLPAETASFLNGPIEAAVNADTGWIFSVGALLALWGARGAISAIITGLNESYGVENDPRSWLVRSLLPIGLSLLLVVLIAISGLVFTLGSDLGADIADSIGLRTAFSTVSGWLRWPLVVAITVFAVMVLHRYGPAERHPFRWYLPGAAFTVVGSYLATTGLTVWFSRSGGYAETYGVFGSVLAFIFWLYVIGFVILLGGAINAVVHEDRQTMVPEAANVD